MNLGDLPVPGWDDTAAPIGLFIRPNSPLGVNPPDCGEGAAMLYHEKGCSWQISPLPRREEYCFLPTNTQVWMNKEEQQGR